MKENGEFKREVHETTHLIMTVVEEWIKNNTIVSAMTLGSENCKPIDLKEIVNNMSLPEVIG